MKSYNLSSVKRELKSGFYYLADIDELVEIDVIGSGATMFTSDLYFAKLKSLSSAQVSYLFLGY